MKKQEGKEMNDLEKILDDVAGGATIRGVLFGEPVEL